MTAIRGFCDARLKEDCNKLEELTGYVARLHVINGQKVIIGTYKNYDYYVYINRNYPFHDYITCESPKIVYLNNITGMSKEIDYIYVPEMRFNQIIHHINLALDI